MTCGRCGSVYLDPRHLWAIIEPLEQESTAMSGRADDDLIRAYVLDLLARGCRPRTRREAETTLRAFARSTGRSLAAATVDDCRTYLSREGLAASSVRTYRGLLSGFFAFTAAEGLTQGNPAARLKRVRIPRAEPDPLTTEQIRSVLRSCRRRRTRMAVLLGALQGMRAAEIAAVHGSAIDWDRLEITIHEGKGGTALRRPLHPDVEELAHSFPADDWWFPSTISGHHIDSKAVSKVLGDALRRVGISGHRPHHLRAWHATTLVEAGADLVTVQASMRHANLSALHHYTKPSNDRVRTALASLPSLHTSEPRGD